MIYCIYIQEDCRGMVVKYNSVRTHAHCCVHQ